MLPKTLRLKRDADFSRVYRRGRKGHSKSFVVTVLQNNLTHPRFACVVPKTISKRAVVRNKIRRLVHEVLVLELKNQPKLATLPYDVVLSAKKGSQDIELKDLLSELHTPLAHLGDKVPYSTKSWPKK
jgi:ribonuclease P protein component